MRGRSRHLHSQMPPMPTAFAIATRSLAFGDGKALVDFVPVDDVPPGGEVVWAAVLVLEVVGVLPNVVKQDGIEALREGRVLVGCGDDLELACLEDQPTPAGAELLGGGLVEGLLEGLKVAEISDDVGGDGAGGRAADAVGADLAHQAPEGCVVGVAAAVVADRGANILGNLGQAANQVVNGFG